MVHELGHALEECPGNLDIKAACVAFRDYRCGDEPLVSLALHGSVGMWREMGRKDNFDRALGLSTAYYVGKDYTNGGKLKAYGLKYDSTEVLAIGLQSLYENPARFCAKDPEYAQFLIGILKRSTKYDDLIPESERPAKKSLRSWLGL